jgi:hypothetical protein
MSLGQEASLLCKVAVRAVCDSVYDVTVHGIKVAGTLRVPSAEAEQGMADGTRSVPATLARPVNGYFATDSADYQTPTGVRPNLDQGVSIV